MGFVNGFSLGCPGPFCFTDGGDVVPRGSYTVNATANFQFSDGHTGSQGCAVTVSLPSTPVAEGQCTGTAP